MARARFAEQLHTRREQLRLTIPQAAKVLRMRESVIVAFENGDFDHLPPLGYAQGMISSYARYLGLDPMELTSLFEAEHAAYVTEKTGVRPSGLASLSDEPAYHDPASGATRVNARSNSNYPNQDYSGAPYGSSGRVSEPMPRPGTGTAGAVPAGSAAPTHAMRPTNLPQRYGSSYGQGVMASEERTGTGRRYSDELRYSGSSYGARGAQEDVDTGASRGSRRYTTRAPEQASERTRRSQAERVRKSRSSDEFASEYAGSARERYSSMQERYERTGSPYAASYQQTDIQTRSVSGAYRDDLRYDSQTSSYRPSSTREGREGVRNMPTPERPNVRRRSSDNPRNRRQQQPQATGLAGYAQAFFADSQRAILSIVVLLTLVLLIILVLSIKSCVAANATDSRQVNVVTSLAASTTAESASTASEAEQQVLSAAAAKAAASADAAQYTETKVKVSVADGATTWVEITCDGEQKVAESITGAWSAEYTVTQSITIQVVDASSVTVEKNGEVQSFAGKSAGLSSITIEGTDPAAAAAATAATTSSEDDSSEDSDTYSDDSEYYSDDSYDYEE